MKLRDPEPREGDGECIVSRDEASGAGLRLPRVREWRTNRDEFLGTDTTLAISAR
jgi:hypothetical protein